MTGLLRETSFMSQCGSIAIHEERRWRMPDVIESRDLDDPKMVVSRWQGIDRNEHSFEIVGNYHIVAIFLQPSRFSLWLGRTFIPHRKVVPGFIHVTPPRLPARIAYSEAYDVLHLHIPNSLLADSLEWFQGEGVTGRTAHQNPLAVQDELLQRLGNALSSIDGTASNDRLFADFASVAIVARLPNIRGDGALPTNPKATALPKWRLKCALEFIETHLDARVALADIAGATGLSRMHFAAQFREATGFRPHEYVLKRRVEKAQSMLATTDVPIVELALAVGFSTQAHFTTVFSRFSGLTPHRWRRNYRM